MDKYLQAEYIFNKLNEAGAGLGNASIFIIKGALQDLEAAQQSFAPDEGYCRCPITKTEAVLAGSLCPKCFRPRR